MKRLAATLAAMALVLVLAACPTDQEVAANKAAIDSLRTWVNLVTTDNQTTTGDYDQVQDPNYLLLQTQAICQAVEWIKGFHSDLSQNAVPPEVVALCRTGQDPVFPPKFPPQM